jgi:glycosyltransferase involved in cell wall biosynthesis
VRFLLLNQFYAPDIAPTGQVLHDVAVNLVSKGHTVTVICSNRSYDARTVYPPREAIAGVEVRRVGGLGWGRRGSLLRAVDFLAFYVLAAWRAAFLDARPDVVVALTTPPFIGVLARLLARLWRCGRVQWVMDVYPDVLFAHGLVSERGFVAKCLRALARAEASGASLSLALGPFMARRIGPYTTHSARVEWVPLWGEQPAEAAIHAIAAVRAERGWTDDELVLMYSGNMGLGHRFGEFLTAARQLGPAGPRWAFAGAGKRRSEVEAFALAHPEARIQLLSYVPRERLRASLASADVHLASLDSRWQGMMVPSKLQGLFAVGRPVIFVGGRNNEIAAWIEESGGGWVVAEGDVPGLLEAITEARDPRQRGVRAAAALAYARQHFDPQRNAERVATLFAAAGRPNAP